ncbi:MULTISPECIES: hypothetical protein [Microbispora]|uniref:hypothetical protein n=1 Tax=Microbispora TaxID=2005 RepID=UPI00140476AF|nr:MULTISPECIES: hypothetical protein [Microbispora]MBO4269337.1 hypothetical protein [Microbispora triticiradicis]GLW23654.1 hypothetical protein Mame01_36970 [Microbispora amethystogenes]
MTEARMTESRMNMTRMTEMTRTASPTAARAAGRPAAPSGILVISQFHRVSEDM